MYIQIRQMILKVLCFFFVFFFERVENSLKNPENLKMFENFFVYTDLAYMYRYVK
jgi:hypothetical protein